MNINHISLINKILLFFSQFFYKFLFTTFTRFTSYKIYITFSIPCTRFPNLEYRLEVIMDSLYNKSFQICDKNLELFRILFEIMKFLKIWNKFLKNF